MKIAMCASEVVPFAKTGGLADVTGALPFALEALGHEVIIIMPGYKQIPDKKSVIGKISGFILSKTMPISAATAFTEIKKAIIKIT